MDDALSAFDANINRVWELHGLHEMLIKIAPHVDLSDLLRAEIVLGVSALDYLIHEIVLRGMLDCWKNKRTHTKSFEKFPLPIAAALSLTNLASAELVIEEEIRKKHSFIAFQQPEKIAEGIRLFSEVKLWEEVGKELGEEDSAIKLRLKFIIDRRNKISHEADIDLSYPSQRWPIEPSLVADTLNELTRIAHAIAKITSRLI